MQRSDYETVQLAKSGDQTAFFRLYSGSRDLAYATVKKSIVAEQEQKRILRSAYLAAFERLDTFAPTDSFDHFVAQIAAEEIGGETFPPPPPVAMPSDMARELFQEIHLGPSKGVSPYRKEKVRKHKKKMGKKGIAIIIAIAVAVGVAVPVSAFQIRRFQQKRELERMAASASRSMAELEEQRRRDNEAYERAAREAASQREADLGIADVPINGEMEQESDKE